MKKQKKCSKMFTETITELQARGHSLQEIADKLGVSRQHLYRFRMKNNLQKSAKGKKSKIDMTFFTELHGKGFSDGVIAKHLGVTRSRVVKIREKLGFPPNHKVGKRGPGKLRDKVPYLEEIRRIYRDPETATIIRKAAQKFREDGGGEETAWAATLIEPCPVFHPAPGSYCTPADKTNLFHVKYAAQFEAKMDFAGLCGLPSIQLVEKALELRGLPHMAPSLSALVASSGYLGSHITTGQARETGPDSVHTWNSIWERHLEESMKWAPIQKEKKVQANIQTNTKSRVSISNGKKGKNGGRQNIQAARAHLGAAGY